ncbi:MAG: hypothetical protein V1808_03955 [Candidatus Daviesbacteria bacterium]
MANEFINKDISTGEIISFYDEKLIPSLKSVVSQAEEDRKSGNHQAIQSAFEFWIDATRDQQIFHRLMLQAQEFELDLSLQRDILKVGFAGLGRIQHVDANSELKMVKTQESTDRIMGRINQATELYARLDLESLDPWTIDGSSIFWSAEIAQDKANTAIITGQENLAKSTLERALVEINRAINGPKVNLETPDNVLRVENYSLFKERKRFIGALSSRGVIYYRIALITHEVDDMMAALNFTNIADSFQPNLHRLATVSQKTLQAAFSLNYRGSLYLRESAIIMGTQHLIEAFFTSPKDTISAVRQAIRERKNNLTAG